MNDKQLLALSIIKKVNIYKEDNDSENDLSINDIFLKSYTDILLDYEQKENLTLEYFSTKIFEKKTQWK